MWFRQLFLSLLFFITTTIHLDDRPGNILITYKSDTAYLSGNDLDMGPRGINLAEKASVSETVDPQLESRVKMAFIRQTHNGKWDVGIPVAVWRRYRLQHPSFQPPSEVTGADEGYYPSQAGTVKVWSSDMEWGMPHRLVTPSGEKTKLEGPPVLLEYWGPNTEVLKAPTTLDIKGLTPALPMTSDGYHHEIFDIEQDAMDFVKQVAETGSPIPLLPDTVAADITQNPPTLSQTSSGIVADELNRSLGQQTTVSENNYTVKKKLPATYVHKKKPPAPKSLTKKKTPEDFQKL